MRRFVVSYGLRLGYGVFNETTEEIEIPCENSLSDGNLALCILNRLIHTKGSSKVILYNFWEIHDKT